VCQCFSVSVWPEAEHRIRLWWFLTFSQRLTAWGRPIHAGVVTPLQYRGAGLHCLHVFLPHLVQVSPRLLVLHRVRLQGEPLPGVPAQVEHHRLVTVVPDVSSGDILDVTNGQRSMPWLSSSSPVVQV